MFSYLKIKLFQHILYLSIVVLSIIGIFASGKLDISTSGTKLDTY